MTKPRIAIIGAGSLGTVMGAIVTTKGGECVLVDTNKEHVAALNQNGATVTGFMDLKNIPVTAITPGEMTGIYDIIILLIKQTANETALKALLPYLGERSVVCTLQNGIPEPSVADVVGVSRTLGAPVGWGAGWIAPGVAQLYTQVEHMRVELGSLDGKITEQLKKVEAFLKLSGEVDISTNLLGLRWSKLLMNSALSGMSAALACIFGEVLDDEKGARCAAHIANEVVRVSREKGVKLEIIIPGYDFYDLEFDNRHGRDKAISLLRAMYERHRPSKASMLQDMEKNIPCEIDYINGLVCKEGTVYNIPTPFNDTVVNIVKDFESKELGFPTIANLKYFDIPEL